MGDGSRVHALIGQKEMSIAYEACIAALQLMPHSARIERACSSRKVIHSKSRNRLKNAKVQKFLYNCVNLHILTGSSSEDTGDIFSGGDGLLQLEDAAESRESQPAAGNINAQEVMIILIYAKALVDMQTRIQNSPNMDLALHMKQPVANN